VSLIAMTAGSRLTCQGTTIAKDRQAQHAELVTMRLQVRLSPGAVR